jgi:hypothetical protein
VLDYYDCEICLLTLERSAVVKSYVRAWGLCKLVTVFVSAMLVSQGESQLPSYSPASLVVLEITSLS